MKRKEKRQEEKQISFADFMLRVIDELNAEERFSTAHVYFYALQAYKQFVGGGEIYFGSINRYSLKRFERYLTDGQKKWNTVSTYTRALRSVYHRAVDAEMIPGEYRLFSGVFTGTKVERKRALQVKEMQALLADDGLCSPQAAAAKAVSPPPLHHLKALPRELYQARDLLSLMLRLQGMPFVDLMHLHRGDLHTDANGCTVLSCHRQKTGIELNVNVTPETLALIDRYRSTDPASPYLLRFFDGIAGARDIYEEYCRQLRLLNSRLARLAVTRGLKGLRVSSYTARHTWATTAKYCMVPESVISEGLGHSSPEVTRTYMKAFEGGELTRANELVMARIFGGEVKCWE